MSIVDRELLLFFIKKIVAIENILQYICECKNMQREKQIFFCYLNSKTKVLVFPLRHFAEFNRGK